MDVIVVELPGGMGEGWQCPNCSRVYYMTDPDKNDERQDCPRACKRCGSPMDAEQGKAYGEKQAELAVASAPVGARRTVKV